MSSGKAVTPPRPAVGLALCLTISLLAITAYYVFLVSAGRFTVWHRHTEFYTQLADGFLQGQLHLLLPPAPELVRATDPYEPRYRHLWLWDACLYQGRYYIYWGPLPALLTAAVKLFISDVHHLGDHHVAFAFMVGRLLAATVLLVLARSWLFPDRRRIPAIVGAVIVLALVNPYPFTLGRLAVYEAAIESAQFFLICGLTTALIVISRPQRRRAQVAWLIATGLAWGGVLACRISLVFAVGALVLLTSAVPRLLGRSWRACALWLALLSTPIALCGLLLGYYNYARFGSWTEFGVSYQLTTYAFQTKLEWLAPNLQHYLLRPYSVSCEFPFLDAPRTARYLARRSHLHSGYVPLEPVVGLVLGFPCLLFCLFGTWLTVRRTRAACVATSASPPEQARTRTAYAWLVLGGMTVGCMSALPALVMFSSTMRYLADVITGLVLASLLGFWALTEQLGRFGKLAQRASAVSGAALYAYTVAVGVLLGFRGGYYDSLKEHNPALRAKLIREFSLCSREAAGSGDARSGGGPHTP